jgi:hypothetical protein
MIQSVLQSRPCRKEISAFDSVYIYSVKSLCNVYRVDQWRGYLQKLCLEMRIMYFEFPGFFFYLRLFRIMSQRCMRLLENKIMVVMSKNSYY